MKNKFLLEMKSRGYLSQCTDLDGLDKICNKNQCTGYIGFDCTAKVSCGKSFTNNDFKLMQKYGHTPIVLLGGGTTLIGDPSGKGFYKENFRSKGNKKKY